MQIPYQASWASVRLLDPEELTYRSRQWHLEALHRQSIQNSARYQPRPDLHSFGLIRVDIRARCECGWCPLVAGPGGASEQETPQLCGQGTVTAAPTDATQLQHRISDGNDSAQQIRLKVQLALLNYPVVLVCDRPMYPHTTTGPWFHEEGCDYICCTTLRQYHGKSMDMILIHLVLACPGCWGHGTSGQELTLDAPKVAATWHSDQALCALHYTHSTRTHLNVWGYNATGHFGPALRSKTTRFRPCGLKSKCPAIEYAGPARKHSTTPLSR
ncbi:hypothetical protein B0T17DRAFT_506039 [Bombardia bombarda]|uniref:Uncharacterized protein n=1 Tax=Bombardia bombarda TaxID=252184 RepID=A0AA40C9F4_9PEZI|nr:hypothetical protein B0T17DRAFT_506039 [Bombardia bombarda]